MKSKYRFILLISCFQNVLKVFGVWTVGNRVRRVKTEVFVTSVTGRVCVRRDSSADCVRTVSSCDISFSSVDIKERLTVDVC